MKKTLLLFTLIALAFAVNAQQLMVQQVDSRTMQKAPMAQDGEMEYGYCSDEVATALGFNMPWLTNALIEIPAEQAAELEGAQITKVKMYIANFGGNKVKAVIYKSLDDIEPAYAEEATVTANAWNEITLTTPYTIGTKAVYVGFQAECTSQDYPIGIDAGPACPQGDIMGYLDDSGIFGDTEFFYMHVGEQGFGNLCIKAVLSGDNLPKYDVALDNIIVDEYVAIGEEFTLGGTVTNVASKAVTSYDVSYQIDNQLPVAKTIYCSLNPGQSHSFEIDGLKFDAAGTYNVKVTVANLNGNTDENPDDNTLLQEVTAMNDFATRKVLIEQFTGQSCGNCPRVHEYLENIGKRRNDFALVVHHAGYYPDSYTINESVKYEWFYDSPETFAPALMMDRTNLDHLGVQSGTSPVFGPSDETVVENLLEYCLSQPAIVNVDIERSYNKDTRELAVEVSGKFQTTPSRNTYLHIFLTEDGLVGQQSGVQGDYVHNHTIRKVVTATWGDKLTLSDNSYAKTYTCTLDQEWVPENMNIVAFVAFNNNNDVSDCKVLNTNDISLTDKAGVNGIVADNVTVWTAGKTICVNGTYNEAAVYTVDGRMVATANNATMIDVENNGIYIVVIDGTSHKVVVK